MEGTAGTLAAAAWQVIGDLGGVLIETSTLATTEVGLVTISWTAGSTTSVGKVGLVITLSSAPGKTDGTSLVDIIGSGVASVTTVPSTSVPLAGSGR